MSWFLLFLAICLEVGATSFLKLSNGWSKLAPSAMALILFSTGTFLYAFALKKIPVSIAYAVWSGLGTVGMVLIGWWFFKESMNPTKIFFISLIFIGVVGLHLKDG
jgi:small multidrug resistance pump